MPLQLVSKGVPSGFFATSCARSASTGSCVIDGKRQEPQPGRQPQRRESGRQPASSRPCTGRAGSTLVKSLAGPLRFWPVLPQVVDLDEADSRNP